MVRGRLEEIPKLLAEAEVLTHALPGKLRADPDKPGA